MNWDDDTQVDLAVRFIESGRQSCVGCVVVELEEMPPSTKRITQPWWTNDEENER